MTAVSGQMQIQRTSSNSAFFYYQKEFQNV